MDAQRIAQLQAAAKVIEADGTEGIRSASALVGEDVAFGMLVFNMRYAFGAQQSFPSSPDIDARVVRILRRHNLIQ